MKPTELLFVTFAKTVAALSKYSGETVWTWAIPKGAIYNALLVEGDKVYVSASGYMYALDAFSGHLIWSNELKGLGTGVPCLATTLSSTGIASHAAAVAAAAAAANAAHGHAH